MYEELGHQYQIPLFTDILERIWDKRLEINPDLQNKYIKIWSSNKETNVAVVHRPKHEKYGRNNNNKYYYLTVYSKLFRVHSQYLYLNKKHSIHRYT